LRQELKIWLLANYQGSPVKCFQDGNGGIKIQAFRIARGYRSRKGQSILFGTNSRRLQGLQNSFVTVMKAGGIPYQILKQNEVQYSHLCGIFQELR
jgi:hypothetical protein